MRQELGGAQRETPRTRIGRLSDHMLGGKAREKEKGLFCSAAAHLHDLGTHEHKKKAGLWKKLPRFEVKSRDDGAETGTAPQKKIIIV